MIVLKPKKAWKIESGNKGIFVFMAQHFLLSANARRLSLTQVVGLADAEILALLKNARWGTEDEQVCPRCGVRHSAYFINTRQQWQCKHCHARFSITTGTIFQFHKLSLRQILMALYLFTTESKGLSAVSLSHKLNVQYKTAWVLLHKLRESLNLTKDLTPLSGEVHSDGCYVNYYIRPKNFKHRRIDRRAKRNQRQDKACVMVFRQRAANQSIIKGANRSIVAMIKEENSDDILALTHRLVKANSMICADENAAYDLLNIHYRLERVNHSQEYCSIDGITNNLAESFFARFRRMITGVHHRISNNYMMHYANEIAWREDERRKSVKEKFTQLLNKCLSCPPSRHFVGYWQGNKRPIAVFGIASLSENEAHYHLVI
ncbi:transposase [Mannheimia varigena USDA-ARS-USMARC-1312]|nr:transposase [Mannheimia varigena USDA-ARS-USMARC-1312]